MNRKYRDYAIIKIDIFNFEFSGEIIINLFKKNKQDINEGIHNMKIKKKSKNN